MNRPKPPAQSPRGSNVGTYLALVGLIAIAAGLLALAAMVNIAIFGVLLVIVGFGLFGLFHYFVWGWWMSRITVDDYEDDESKPRT